MVVQHIGVISANAVCKLEEEGIDINNAPKAYLLLYEHLLFIPQISEDDYYGPSVIWNQVSNASHEATDPESPRFKHAIISLNDYVPSSQRLPSELARRANIPLHPLIERHRKYRELLVDAFILNYMNTKAAVPDTEGIDPFSLSDIAMALAAKDFFGCNSGLLCGAHKERYVAAVTPTYPCCFDSDDVRLVRASIEPAVEAHRASLPEIGSAFTTHLQSATEEVARFVRADGLTAFTWDQLLELREDKYFPAFRKRIHKALRDTSYTSADIHALLVNDLFAFVNSKTVCSKDRH